MVRGSPILKNNPEVWNCNNFSRCMWSTWEDTDTNVMFCWLCIIVCQCNETNVMHYSFNLLRIKSRYLFRALLTHPQEALHKQHLVYFVRMSVGCVTIVVSLQLWHNQLTLYARNIPSAVCEAPPEDEQVMLKICSGSWFSVNWMNSASRWFRDTGTDTTLMIWSTQILLSCCNYVVFACVLGIFLYA
jgi:hypothetical protein